jgi:hypothetical protein
VADTIDTRLVLRQAAQVLEIRVLDLPEVREFVEDLQLRVTQLEEERDFWQNEFDEVVMAIGHDPRHHAST